MHLTSLSHSCLAVVEMSMGFPGGASGKEPTCQCRRHKRLRFDLWVRKIPWRRAWQPTQYSCLENSMDRGTWWATVRGVAKSQTRLSTHTQRERLCIGHRPRNVSHLFCSHFIGKNLNTRLRLKIQSPAQRPHTCLQLDYHLGRMGK